MLGFDPRDDLDEVLEPRPAQFRGKQVVDLEDAGAPDSLKLGKLERVLRVHNERLAINFTTKIGTGMGEQMLSREYYYLGTQLPIDRFLSFYYAHPGFHLNNMFIMLSVQLFMVVLINLGLFDTR